MLLRVGNCSTNSCPSWIGFVFGLTKTLRTTFYSANKGEIKQLGDNDKVSVPLSTAIRQIRFSADEKQILIAFDGGSLSVYNTDDILNQVGSFKQRVALPPYWSVDYRKTRSNLSILFNWKMMLPMYDPIPKHMATWQQCYTQTNNVLWLTFQLETRNAHFPWTISQPFVGHSRESKLSVVKVMVGSSISISRAQWRIVWVYQKRCVPATVTR